MTCGIIILWWHICVFLIDTVKYHTWEKQYTKPQVSMRGSVITVECEPKKENGEEGENDGMLLTRIDEKWMHSVVPVDSQRELLIAAVKMQEQNKEVIMLDVFYSEAISHNNRERFYARHYSQFHFRNRNLIIRKLCNITMQRPRP